MELMHLKKIRVLIVDDSAFMRKIITDILSSESFIEVVDTARDGLWALEKLKSLDVDVITMDVEMPRMDGVEALKKINELYKIPVLMLSSFTKEGADITIKALELGAFDFVPKPNFKENFDIESLKAELIQKIKLCCGTKKHIERIEAGVLAASEDYDIKRCRKSSKISLNNAKNLKAVCIAASTGGPKALTKVMSDFPEGFNIPVLIVQHMPQGFTKAFAERLNSISKLTVKEAEDGEEIKKGYAYIAPGGYHMIVKNNSLYLSLEPPMHGVRPCADKLFISAAENFSGSVIGIVMTGMGKDGTKGLEAIWEKGGFCIAEDESTCTIFGMPNSAIKKGVVHVVAPLEKIVPEVLRITGIGEEEHGN